MSCQLCPSFVSPQSLVVACSLRSSLTDLSHPIAVSDCIGETFDSKEVQVSFRETSIAIPRLRH